MQEKEKDAILNAHSKNENGVFNTEKEEIKEGLELEKENKISNEENTPLDKNIKLMSPTRMVLRRFFRSKLSIIGLVMVLGLFVFTFIGPYVYHVLVPAKGILGNDETAGWQEIDADKSGKTEYVESSFDFQIKDSATGEYKDKKFTVKQTLEKFEAANSLAPISPLHPLGTDNAGYDNLSKIMYGGRVSLKVSFMAVFIMTALGIVFGGLSGYFGGVIDNIIMRVCDVLTCLPGIPIMLIVGAALNEMARNGVIDHADKIYILMFFLSCISWPGMARVVRGQILYLREQEYMIAAEAMGYSVFRKIFIHLIPNVLPQLIVQMTLGLGSMIIYESSLSFLGFGVDAPRGAWGSTLEGAFKLNFDTVLANPLIWLPAGLCIIIAVLGFNFVGDGLRDALDPKSRR